MSTEDRLSRQFPVACYHRVFAYLASSDAKALIVRYLFTRGVDSCRVPRALLSSLTNLEELDLSRASLKGALPKELGALPRVRALNLAGNALTGEIPLAFLRWKFVEKRTVELRQNRGLTLPADIGDLGTSVTDIDLSDHNLRGGLPKGLGKLVNLRVLNLSDNCQYGKDVYGRPDRTKPIHDDGPTTTGLSGALPATLGELSNLTRLNLSRNRLTGELPLEIIGLKAKGVEVSLSNNRGLTLPAVNIIGTGGTKLMFGYGSIDLSNCSLTGELPLSFIRMKAKGKKVLLSGNRLTLPASVGELGDPSFGPGTPGHRGGRAAGAADCAIGRGGRHLATMRLKELDLSHCSLTGALPIEISELEGLTKLSLLNNMLSGEIPLALLRWKFVEKRAVSLRGNRGLSLPPDLGDLGGTLTALDLSNHNLRGALPRVLPSSLELLSLGDSSSNSNALTGGIPDAWGAFTRLKTLKLVSCKLDGLVPLNALCKLTRLEALWLQNNRFDGRLEAKKALETRLPHCRSLII